MQFLHLLNKVVEGTCHALYQQLCWHFVDRIHHVNLLLFAVSNAENDEAGHADLLEECIALFLDGSEVHSDAGNGEPIIAGSWTMV